ncbi:peptide chain release factor 2 [Rickettsia endosymbiont of Cardiosporidium cionae]|nr:peptide chain release factor 2 [Rickettsia endosymbiont of Cardiosporidium cionae]
MLKEKIFIEKNIGSFKKIDNQLKDNVELYQIIEDDYGIDDAEMDNLVSDMSKLDSVAEMLKMNSLFYDINDHNNCFIEINAGAGGTESHDWAMMMMRMYLRFAEKKGFKSEILNIVKGEDAGIKSCCIKIVGDMSYGWFKTETGVHRLVRISPFNAVGKRMTSFASFWAYPEIDQDIKINIDEKDLRIDTYRSSGAGGQHVNTTDSAVRITYLPSNIVVQCQNQRSQHRNKLEAMKILRSRLFDIEQKKMNEDSIKKHKEKGEISWGNQIRSYILQPYQMVKDLRTNYETSNANSVLDGNLEIFITKSLALVKKTDI